MSVSGDSRVICIALGGIFSELLGIYFRYILRVVSGRLQEFQRPLDIILILSSRSLG